MDFVLGLPPTKKAENSIWVIMDKLIKSTYFLPIQNTYSMDKYAKLYIDETVRLCLIKILNLCQIFGSIYTKR